MKVIAYDKFIDHDFARDNQVEYVELEEIFRQSDIISLTARLQKKPST